MNNLIELNGEDLVYALGIILGAIAISRWQKLGLESQLIFAAGRSVLQLLVVGYFLTIIFALKNPLSVLGLLLIMLSIAAVVTRNRISQKLKGLLGSIWLSLFWGNVLTLAYTIVLIIRPSPWYEPQYLIPLMGMILGQGMNSASLTGERLVSLITTNRWEIETHLCLGATPTQAIARYRTEAIRTGFIPILNQMTVVGIVSLPGMFTGQVLAGTNPLSAAAYQILILFMIVLSNLITIVLVTRGLTRRFFNPAAQLVLP
ncbi:iron export ABC transporter permease subunit FetB [Gloeocapsa sp. PCC 73106]|uniref:ABC transporter permease n=1 Tax=Gloeocapsa sp. PCC 73106 TaxID=102232 RepID=UPI0002AC3A8A|nr:iron export ABC transporter permease subunit FetB [Gloeocapsa sp. PCC 73106]ELR99839.1 TIGR00245 family protein [Gloeocapsa sp. PCC 73106]